MPLQRLSIFETTSGAKSSSDLNSFDPSPQRNKSGFFQQNRIFSNMIYLSTYISLKYVYRHAAHVKCIPSE